MGGLFSCEQLGCDMWVLILVLTVGIPLLQMVWSSVIIALVVTGLAGRAARAEEHTSERQSGGSSA